MQRNLWCSQISNEMLRDFENTVKDIRDILETLRKGRVSGIIDRLWPGFVGDKDYKKTV